MPEPRVRVQRALAEAGLASRRAAEDLVRAGVVTINGGVAEIGQTVEPGDEIAVDGVPIRRQEVRTYLLHKPEGMVSTASDPQGRPTVVEAVPSDVRLYPVGRLDFRTTGALLLTNDGELAHKLMHPSSGVPKVYEGLLAGDLGERALGFLRDGVMLDDGITNPAKVEVLHRGRTTTLVRIEISEGRNRQIRRMGEAVGHPVVRLARVRYDGLDLAGLAPGEWRELAPEETSRLGEMVGLAR